MPSSQAGIAPDVSDTNKVKKHSTFIFSDMKALCNITSHNKLNVIEFLPPITAVETSLHSI